MTIQFSQEVIRYLGVYLGTTLGEIARDKDFPYSKPLLYKIADGSIPVSESVNEAFNHFWNQRELTADDLKNIYTLIDIVKAGRLKEKQYRVERFRNSEGKK